MKTFITVCAVAAICLLATAWTASGSPISYTVNGVALQHFIPEPPLPGDTVEVLAGSGDLELAIGTVTQTINTVSWYVDYSTYGTTPYDYNIDVSRQMTIGTDTQNLTQSGLLQIRPDGDLLSFNAGSTATFHVGGYQIDVTPLHVLEAGGSAYNYLGSMSIPMTAQFVITPEPATMAFLLAGGGLTLLRRRRK